MKTCANCIWWHHIGTNPTHRRIVYDTGVRVIPPGEEGQCRGTCPREDFRWPLTSGGDWCGAHATPAPVPTDDALARIEHALAQEHAAAPTHTLEAGTPGAASPAAVSCEAGTEQSPAADDTDNRRPKRVKNAPKA